MATDIFDLRGKVALITGASSGLGRHFSKTLSEAGATVILSARRMDNLVELQKEIKGDSHSIPLDVTSNEKYSPAQYRRLISGYRWALNFLPYRMFQLA